MRRYCTRRDERVEIAKGHRGSLMCVEHGMDGDCIKARCKYCVGASVLDFAAGGASTVDYTRDAGGASAVDYTRQRELDGSERARGLGDFQAMETFLAGTEVILRGIPPRGRGRCMREGYYDNSAVRRLWQEALESSAQRQGRGKLDLTGADFTGACFCLPSGYHLSADFSGARLDDTTWVCDVRGCNFCGARLDDTMWLCGVPGCNFRGASLRRARMVDVDCQGADFRDADLCGANIVGTLRGGPPDFTGADLTNARVVLLGVKPPVPPMKDARVAGCRVCMATWESLKGPRSARVESTRKLFETLTEEQRSGIVFRDAYGKCFLATAAYGTDQACELAILREFRDRILARTTIGRLFIGWYESLAPPIAAVVARSAFLRAAVRGLLLRPLLLMARRLLSGRGT